MAKATTAQRRTAKRDFDEKLRLEKAFTKVMDAYFNQVVNAMGFSLSNSVVLNVHQQFGTELEEILTTQYKRVEKEFSNEISKQLPKEVAQTEAEDILINRALNAFNVFRAPRVALEMNKTTQKDIQQSIMQAQSFNTETDELVDGKVVEKKQVLVGFELILTAKKILKRKLLGRIPSIVATETEVPAEASKLTESEVLQGQVPSILNGGPPEAAAQDTATKVWVSMGDSVVRPTHLEADGQEVKSNEPFTVGGFSLLMPGDSSLGAPAEETIGCRCAAVFNDKEIVAIRVRRSEDDALASFLTTGEV